MLDGAPGAATPPGIEDCDTRCGPLQERATLGMATQPTPPTERRIAGPRPAKDIQMNARVCWGCGCPEHARAMLEADDHNGWAREPETRCRAGLSEGEQ